MKRPLMGMGIALVAGAAAVWAEMPLLCVCFGALAALLYLKFRTDSSWKYILGLSVFFDCRILSDYGRRAKGSTFGRRCLRPAL